MSLVKTWYSIEDALSKFGIDRQKLDAWIEAGLVRTEEEKGEVVRVNIDDVRIEVENMVNADE
ncbi:MAG: MerR family transcriptional regulator [Deltaproteobacteria bacterium]|nr:MAG: MerR family transcriptional regulator [Deltaproteobacteria bacterium]